MKNYRYYNENVSSSIKTNVTPKDLMAATLARSHEFSPADLDVKFSFLANTTSQSRQNKNQ